MKISDKQLTYLMQVLYDSLKVRDTKEFSLNHDGRELLYRQIVNQQSGKPVEREQDQGGGKTTYPLRYAYFDDKVTIGDRPEGITKEVEDE